MTHSSPPTLVIASRESRLAMWQARDVQARLGLLYPQCSVNILGMTTRGDQILDRSLSKVGGKGLFVKELEVALEEGRADLAVHSLKDVPMELPPGFLLAAILQREDPHDAFVSNRYASIAELPEGAIIGTSSLRRQALLASQFPHLQFKPLRGNLDTRLGKLDSGEYAAIILAVAGLKRLGLAHRIASSLPIELSLPAAGQGAMAIEIHQNNVALQDILAPLNHPETAYAVQAERVVSRMLGGSCQVPLAAHARVIDGAMHLRAIVASIDGRRLVSAEGSGPIDDPQTLGVTVTQALQAQGAEEILQQCLQNP